MILAHIGSVALVVYIRLANAEGVLNQFTFYENVDSKGNDIYFRVPEATCSRSIAELAEDCLKLGNCEGFNTIGYMKHTIESKCNWNNMDDSVWVEAGCKVGTIAGLYVRNDVAVNEEEDCSIEQISAPFDTISSPLDSFKFYKYLDSTGNDIEKFHCASGPEEVAKRCMETEGCKGFNTGGLVKHTIRSYCEWDHVDASTWAQKGCPEGAGGLYVRNDVTVDEDCPLSNFKFYQNLDSKGNDIGAIGLDCEKNPTEIAKICMNMKECKGFNSLGWLKHTIDSFCDLHHLDDSVLIDSGCQHGGGLYVKHDVDIEEMVDCSSSSEKAETAFLSSGSSWVVEALSLLLAGAIVIGIYYGLKKTLR